MLIRTRYVQCIELTNNKNLLIGFLNFEKNKFKIKVIITNFTKFYKTNNIVNTSPPITAYGSNWTLKTFLNETNSSHEKAKDLSVYLACNFDNLKNDPIEIKGEIKIKSNNNVDYIKSNNHLKTILKL
jgi:hypothetical protein